MFLEVSCFKILDGSRHAPVVVLIWASTFFNNLSGKVVQQEGNYRITEYRSICLIGNISIYQAWALLFRSFCSAFVLQIRRRQFDRLTLHILLFQDRYGRIKTFHKPQPKRRYGWWIFVILLVEWFWMLSLIFWTCLGWIILGMGLCNSLPIRSFRALSQFFQSVLQLLG